MGRFPTNSLFNNFVSCRMNPSILYFSLQYIQSELNAPDSHPWAENISCCNQFSRCSYLENLDKHWYSISSKLVWKTQIHVGYNITIFKNLIIKVLEMIRNFRNPLTLYKCMKKWYIFQAFSIFSIRYKKC